MGQVDQTCTAKSSPLHAAESNTWTYVLWSLSQAFLHFMLSASSSNYHFFLRHLNTATYTPLKSCTLSSSRPVCDWNNRNTHSRWNSSSCNTRQRHCWKYLMVRGNEMESSCKKNRNSISIVVYYRICNSISIVVYYRICNSISIVVYYRNCNSISIVVYYRIWKAEICGNATFSYTATVTNTSGLYCLEQQTCSQRPIGLLLFYFYCLHFVF